MYEASKSCKRRFYNGNFISKYFVGNGIDVGCGSDTVGRYYRQFPLIKSVKPFDMEDGDAQYLTRYCQPQSFDFLHSSHSLEHMVDPRVALKQLIECVRIGGYLIITVPDEDMYEHGQWPSQFNHDHKWSFTIHKAKSAMPKSINVLDLIQESSELVTCEKVEIINDFYNPEDQFDQTMTPNPECSIEIILRRIA